MTQLRTLTAGQQLVGVGLPPVDLSTTDAVFRPQRFASLAEARTALGAPAGANYVMWTFGNADLETVFATQLSDNDILVLPERDDPYLIDSSNGFMAGGVAEVDGVGANGLKNGSRYPIVSNSRNWFSMARARRGIIGLGPNVVIQPSVSSWTQGRWPVLQNEPAGQQFQKRYMADGSSADMVGAQCKLIDCESANPFFANFTLRGRDFGGVQYNGLVMTGSTFKTVKRIYFDGCWRGNEGVPNGETGGLSLGQGTYLIEHCDFASNAGPSPIMWNRTQGGTTRHVRSSRPNYGMFTFWRAGKTNVFENVWLDCNRTAMNLEENDGDFALAWTGGKMLLDSPSSKFHFAINPSGGSIKISLTDVECSPNGWTPDTVSVNVYTTAGVQRRSDVTSNGLPVAYLPAANWIN